MRINGRRYSSLPVFFYKITHNLKHAHLRFQLTQNENCKEHLAPSQFLSRQLLKVLSVSASTTKSGKLFHIFTTCEEKENFLNLYSLALFLKFLLISPSSAESIKIQFYRCRDIIMLMDHL